MTIVLIVMTIVLIVMTVVVIVMIIILIVVTIVLKVMTNIYKYIVTNVKPCLIYCLSIQPSKAMTWPYFAQKMYTFSRAAVQAFLSLFFYCLKL